MHRCGHGRLHLKASSVQGSTGEDRDLDFAPRAPELEREDWPEQAAVLVNCAALGHHFTHKVQANSSHLGGGEPCEGKLDPGKANAAS